VRDSRLSFSIDFKEAVGSADAVFIAVGTPSRREDGHADLSYVYEAAREIAATMIDFTVVIVKSAVPVGTCDEIRRIIHHERPQAQWYRIPSFCEKVPLSAISNFQIVSS
jgi:UDPglucose 6-dehydrogenase